MKKCLLLDSLVLLNLCAEDKEGFLKSQVRDKEGVVIRDKDVVKNKRKLD